MDGDCYIFTLRTNEYDIQMRLSHMSLEVLKGSEEEMKKLCSQTYYSMLKFGDIIHFTKNDKYYRDEQQEKLVV